MYSRVNTIWVMSSELSHTEFEIYTAPIHAFRQAAARRSMMVRFSSCLAKSWETFTPSMLSAR